MIESDNVNPIYKRVSLGVLLVFILIGIASKCEPSESYKAMIQARDNLRVGMTREEAETILEPAASHQQCAFDDKASEEIYLFGSKNLKEADIIVVLYHIESGEARLVDFSNPSKEFLQRPQYQSCKEVKEPVKGSGGVE